MEDSKTTTKIYPPFFEAGHTMIIGKTGSGKTCTHDLYAAMRLSDAEMQRLPSLKSD